MTDVMATPRIVGRTHELRVVDETVRATEGAGGLLLVVGEPGIGKSVLLGAGADLAVGRGHRVLRAGGTEFESGISFAGLNQLLLPAIRAAGAPSDLRVALGLAAGPAPDLLTVSNAVLELVASLAESSPVLLVVDDVHWFDRSSAVVLRLVARRLAGLRGGLVVAQRLGAGGFFEPGDGLPRLLLGPLDPAASEDLLRLRHPDLNPRMRRRVLVEAEGNPLALTELPAAGRTPTPVHLPVGRRLQEVFADRIAGLPPRTRSVLLLASLSGGTDVRSVVRSAEELVDLEPALRAGIVQQHHQSGRLSFRHPLIRPAVVDGAGPLERARAHLVLAERSPDPVRRAWHLAAGTVEPDELVARLVEQAAHVVLRRGDAVASVEGLTRAAELSQDREARVRRLAEAATIGAEVAGALHSAEELLAAADRSTSDPAGSLQLSTAAASVLFNRECTVDTPHRLLTLALQTHSDKVDATTVAEALQLLAVVCYFGGRAELWEPFHTALSRLGEQAPVSLRILSGTWDPVHRGRSVLPLLDGEIHGLARQDNPSEIIRLGVASVYVDRVGACAPALWRVVENGREGGAVSAAINAIASLAIDGWQRGRWDQVEELVAEGRRLAEAHGYLRYTWVFDGYVTELVQAARGTGDPVAGAEALEQWAGARGALLVRAMAEQIRCLVALGRGDFETAYRHAVRVSPAGAFPAYMPNALWVFFDLVESAVRSGHTQEGCAHVAAALARSLDELSPRMALLVRAAEALVAPEERRAELFERALAVPGAEQWAFDLARVRLCYGETLRRRRQVSAARRQLTEALAAFDRLGACPWSLRARQELRAAGPTRMKSALLTVQETEIARLAATGLTNKEIGDRLTLSPRTVAAHLYRAFPKLGITSRAALRDALSRQNTPG